MANEAKSVLELMRNNDCDSLDIKFVDVPGTWQHVGLPIGEVNDDLFVRGTGFDGHRQDAGLSIPGRIRLDAVLWRASRLDFSTNRSACLVGSGIR